ncbi:MAG: NADP-dependent phosphogluconate dehydrogenase [Succinivibrio sp.]|nr:NADP-dependent phosphogluconate dehydrogenase [Succinivibrio sp.]
MNDISLIGLGVMGSNLALNIADHGYEIALWNYTSDLVDKFKKDNSHPKCHPFYDLKEMLDSLKKPRCILMMVTAGKAVDSLISQLTPLLDEGDIVVDLGNSLFTDTRRRYAELKEKKIRFYGVGVSGGEEGARHGPAMMVGGEKEGYQYLEKIFCAISAKASEDGKPCCAYMGTDGAGHFVKMVHNGIEYADMQLIAESYLLLKNLGGFSNQKISDIFAKFNQGRLKSYLIEIASKVLAAKDPDGDGDLIDKILDSAGQKGTGKWTAQSGFENGISLSIIDAALNARIDSSYIDQRRRRLNLLSSKPKVCAVENKEELVRIVENSLYAGKIAAYAQGFVFYKKAMENYGWELPIGTIASVFRGGCIIRAEFLNRITASFEQNSNLENLMDSPDFAKEIDNSMPDFRKLVTLAIANGIPAPAYSAAIAYFDAMTTRVVGANMIQGLRDFFGAHTFIYEPTGEVKHHHWN